MDNVQFDEENMRGIEPRFYNLFCDLVDITYTVVFKENVRHIAAPHMPSFEFLNDSINYTVGYELGKITVSYYKPKGVVFVSQEVGHGGVMFVYDETGKNKSKNRFFNANDMKRFWKYWLHQNVTGIPPAQIQDFSFEKKARFLDMTQRILKKLQFFSISMARSKDSPFHTDPDVLHHVTQMAIDPEFRPYF